jgi:hypothetical protein
VTTLRYVYAILAAGAAEAERPDRFALSGIEQAPVRLLVEGALAAALSDVPAEEFDEGPLNERVRDLAWLGPRAVAHQTVNGELFERFDAVLPLAFGAVFRDDEGVRRLLRERAASASAALDRVRGRGEWVIMVHRDEAAALASLDESSPALRDLREQLAAASPGRAYLLRRSVDELRRAELLRRDGEAIGEIVASLEPWVDDAYREELGARAPGGPVARASVLVARTAQPAFEEGLAAIEKRWQARGYALSVTGPWPPYRFGSLLSETAGAAT